jgi:hypothetical protein
VLTDGRFQVTLIRNPFDPDFSKFENGPSHVTVPLTDLPQMQDGCNYVVFDGGVTFEIIDRRSLYHLNDMVAENFLPATQQELSGRARLPRYTIHDVLLDDDKFDEVYLTRPILSGQPPPENNRKTYIVHPQHLPGTWTQEDVDQLLGSFHIHREDTLSNLLGALNEDFLIGLGLDVQTKMAPVYIPDSPQSMDPLWLDVAEFVRTSGPAMSLVAGNSSDPERAWSSHSEDYPDVP